MDRRKFMKLCGAAVAGAGVSGVVPTAAKAAKMMSMGFFAGGQIGAGQLVGIGSDGLCYAMFVEDMIMAMAKAVKLPLELLL